MKYPVNIQDKSSGMVLGVEGKFIHGMYHYTRPERVMVFPSEQVARVFARQRFPRPGQTPEDIETMLSSIVYPDALKPRTS